MKKKGIRMMVGNRGPKDSLFEQKCGCDCFPCSCYTQDKGGNWIENDKLEYS